MTHQAWRPASASMAGSGWETTRGSQIGHVDPLGGQSAGGGLGGAEHLADGQDADRAVALADQAGVEARALRTRRRRAAPASSGSG